ncbi:MAG: GNAT family N-acetyltransferase [Patescibacteria group bacterium]|nr:GNAT family N-acetyltransferase [Patescibacteria group bacterium]
MIRRVQEKDIGQIIPIYKKAFEVSIRHIFGVKLPKNQVYQDIFGLIFETYKNDFFVSENDGISGFIVAPYDDSKIVKNAIFKGYLLKWGWHWLTQKYGFGLRPFFKMFKDKIIFLRSKGRAKKITRSRVLSIAVDPEHQGKGIGAELLQAGLQNLRSKKAAKVILEVREYNLPAKRLYERFRFKEVGRFQDTGGTWIQMVMEL